MNANYKNMHHITENQSVRIKSDFEHKQHAVSMASMWGKSSAQEKNNSEAVKPLVFMPLEDRLLWTGWVTDLEGSMAEP